MGWKRSPIFLWTDVFNLTAQSLRILLVPPVLRCCIFFTCSQTWLWINFYQNWNIYIFFNCQPRRGGLTASTLETSLASVHTLFCADVFLTCTVLLCAVVNRNCNMDVSLYYKNFSALNEKLLFNWHTQDNREWWCSVVQDSAVLYTGSSEVRIDRVGS